MAYLLDVVGSSVLAGLFILMIIGFNMNVDSNSREMYGRTITQGEAIEAVKLLEYDLYKVGYRIAGEKVALAETTKLKFYADLGNNGTLDSVYYHLGGVGQMTSTQNPNDRPVFRVENNASVLCMVVRNFRLTYFDSLGAILPYASLVNASGRAKIRSLQVYVSVESGYPHEGRYDSFSMKRTVKPRNI
jgi:hypothetical protein